MKTKTLLILTSLSTICLFVTSCHPNKEEYYKLLNENRTLLAINDSLQKELDLYQYSPQKLLADVQRFYEIDDRMNLKNTIILLEKYHPESDEYRQSLQIWDQKQKEIEKKLKEIKAKQKESDNISKDMKKFISLYNKLIKFKRTNDFKKYGFAKGGKYYAWLNEATTLNNTAEISNFTEYGIVPGDLVALGYGYVASEGAETESTKSLRKSIEKAIAKVNGER